MPAITSEEVIQVLCRQNSSLITVAWLKTVSRVKAEGEPWVIVSDFATTEKLISKPEEVCNT